jgi:hypothetical protein
MREEDDRLTGLFDEEGRVCGPAVRVRERGDLQRLRAGGGLLIQVLAARGVVADVQARSDGPVSPT